MKNAGLLGLIFALFLAISGQAEKPASGSAAAAFKPVAPPIVLDQQKPPQVNPNQIPNQPGPNIPPGPQGPDLKKPFDSNVAPGGLQPGAVPRDTGGGAIDTLQPDRENLGLNQLNADDARRRPGFDPSRFGRRSASGDADTEALVERLRGITGQSNQDRLSDRTRAFGGGLRPDPNTIPKPNLAGDSVTTAGGGGDAVKIVEHDDGSRTVTERHRDDRGGDQNITTHVGSDGIIKTETIVERAPGGQTMVWTAERMPDGTYWNTISTRNRDGSSRQTEAWRGPAPHVNVDPDSPYGKKAGGVAGLGQNPPKPAMIEARDEGVGPGARPDENANTGVAPRLNVNVDLVGQPNPGEMTSGGSAHRGYNPDDFVRPPRPNEP